MSPSLRKRDVYLTKNSSDVSQSEPSFSEQWLKVENSRETEVYNSPPGLGMMGVPGGPPPPGGP